VGTAQALRPRSRELQPTNQSPLLRQASWRARMRAMTGRGGTSSSTVCCYPALPVGVDQARTPSFTSRSRAACSTSTSALKYGLGLSLNIRS
jgi:hypothetical protein